VEWEIPQATTWFGADVALQSQHLREQMMVAGWVQFWMWGGRFVQADRKGSVPLHKAANRLQILTASRDKRNMGRSPNVNPTDSGGPSKIADDNQMQ